MVDLETGQPIPRKRKVLPGLAKAIDLEARQLEKLRRAEEQKGALVAYRAAVAAERRVRVSSAARVQRQTLRDADDAFFCQSVLPRICERACRDVSRSPRQRIQQSFGTHERRLPPSAAEESRAAEAEVRRAKRAGEPS